LISSIMVLGGPSKSSGVENWSEVGSTQSE
jgi:hypothetical protein